VFVLKANEYVAKVEKAVNFLKKELSSKPLIGIVLGSGLGVIHDSLENPITISYEAIPGFPVSTVEGHKGELVFGKLGNKNVVLMNGRFHYYEGYSMKDITFPIRVMQLLGVEYLFVTNAAGGLNPDFKIGTPMIITDHINMFSDNPLIGENIDEWGPRFPDVSDAYSSDLREIAIDVAHNIGEPIAEGVYVGLSGPNLETPAELRMYRHMGGDAIGMSTVPEALVAAHGGMKVLGFSAITDEASGEDLQPLTFEEVLQAANHTGKKIAKILLVVCEKI